jgi:hypothetical protein
MPYRTTDSKPFGVISHNRRVKTDVLYVEINNDWEFDAEISEE